MLKHGLWIVVVTSVLAAPSSAQRLWLGRPAVPADSVSHSIEEAEAHGVRHQPAVVNNSRDTAFERAIAGTRQRRCVTTDADAMRSGDFVAGPFSSYNRTWKQGYGKIWWQPNEMPPETPVLIVRAARLDQEAEDRVFESADVAWPSGPNESPLTSIKFYPTGIRLPTVGRWLMVATAGNNWGCFIHTVR